MSSSQQQLLVQFPLKPDPDGSGPPQSLGQEAASQEEQQQHHQVSSQENAGGQQVTSQLGSVSVGAAAQPPAATVAMPEQRSPGLIVAPNNNSCNINSNNSHNSTDSERRYRPQKYCAVCGDKAIACNFNAVTCESCKAFFRRNAFKEQRLKCLFDNRCIIDRVTRRFCSKCRLLKCFQIGMKREWILTDEQKQIKRVKIMQNRQSRLEQHQPTATTAPAIQQLPEGHAIYGQASTDNQMALTAAASPPSSGRPCCIGTEEELRQLHVMTPVQVVANANLDTQLPGEQQQPQLVTLESVRDPAEGFLKWNGELFQAPAHSEPGLQARIQKLDFTDHERETIHELMEATKFMFEAGENKYMPSTCLDDIVNFCDAALRRLIKTVKQIKAFRLLSMDDQIVLLKTGCFKILLLRSTFHFQDEYGGWVDKTGKVMPLDILKRARKSLVYEKHCDLVKKIPEPLRKDRFIMAILSLTLLFDPKTNLKHKNSVSLDNLIYLSILRKYLVQTQPDPLNKYETLVSALQVINDCNEEYNVFFSKDFQPEQITPLLVEIFDISTENPM